ncbi:MAG: D-alanine--D-alanine ligase [Gammaproteobacteria bacterium]|nr:D-alanine--D-alanine ligase [Gammaproteobacteria bacterium]
MNIEIITTPNDALKESGFGSLKACKSVLAAIQKMGYKVRLNVCKARSDLEAIVARRPDLVVLAVKYIPREQGNNTLNDNIWLSEYFSEHDINFTGSSREVLEFDSNKVLAKVHLNNKGINTAKYFLAIPGEYKTESELPVSFPLFLKPLDAANGNGIDDLSFVTDFSGYERKIASLFNSFNQPVLVEEYLDGREFTVAVFKPENQALIVSAVEVVPPTSTHGLRILGKKTKIDDSENIIEIIDDEVKNRVKLLAIDAFYTLGARDFGRIDIKTNNHGKCFFMEANLVPGMTRGSSYFPEACNIENAFTYDRVIELLLAGGLARASATVPPLIHSDTNRKHLVALPNMH